MSSVDDKVDEALAKVIPTPVLHNKDRITLVFGLNYEHRPDDPITVGKPAHLFLKGTEDQPEVNKRYKLDQEWTKVKLGDLTGDTVSVIVIENITGAGALTKRSAEEEADIQKRIVEVAYGMPEKNYFGGNESCCFLIPVGWPQFFLPKNADNLWLRSQHGEARCRVSIFPK